MYNIYKKILENKESNRKMLAILLDPDKCRGGVLAATISALKTTLPDFIFVGGSHTLRSTESFIAVLKEETKADVVLFPGNASQFTDRADAMLYLSLVSGRNSEFLIGQHVSSAMAIKRSAIEVISTGYILIDGGNASSVEYMSNTRPIPHDKKEIALSTAVAAELLGMKMIYLEAGSGAAKPVSVQMINHVADGLSIPLVVGGGIKTVEDLKAAYRAGADLVVMGNLFETAPEKIAEFIACSETFVSPREGVV
jgi:phosphoglycerol geranylgeranyltransferase